MSLTFALTSRLGTGFVQALTTLRAFALTEVGLINIRIFLVSRINYAGDYIADVTGRKGGRNHHDTKKHS
jgi:fluoride ion exporter CrcB/FEX